MKPAMSHYATKEDYLEGLANWHVEQINDMLRFIECLSINLSQTDPETSKLLKDYYDGKLKTLNIKPTDKEG